MSKLVDHVYKEYIRTEQKINQAENAIQYSAKRHQEYLKERMRQSKSAKEIDRIRDIIRNK